MQEKTPMNDNLIAIEDRKGPYQPIFQRVMRMVPDRDRTDKKLQRLLAFRLLRDGEAETREFLIGEICKIIKCAYTGSLYNYLTDEDIRSECYSHRIPPEPPAAA